MLIYLFVLHFIADFLLQTREMGKKKSEHFEYLVLHLAIYSMTFVIGLVAFHFINVAIMLFHVHAGAPMYSVVFLNSATIWFLVTLITIHGVQDWFIWKGYKITVYLRDKKATPATWKYWEDSWFYSTIGLDQLLHFATIALLASWAGII